MESSLLLVDTNKINIKNITRTIKTSVPVIEIQPSLHALNLAKYDVILINFDILEDTQKTDILSTTLSPEVQKKTLFFSTKPSKEIWAQFLAKFGLTNFLASNGEVDSEELYITIQKLISKDIFGIEKYFSWGARSLSKGFRSSQEKKEVLDLAATFANEAGLQNRFVDMFTMITEELSTNALYDAPVDQERKHRYAHYSRSQEVTLTSEEEILVTFCCDGRRIGVSVCDPFGSLTHEKILQYINFFLEKNTFFSHHLINFKKNQQSEIICVIDIKNIHANTEPISKSFIVFDGSDKEDLIPVTTKAKHIQPTTPIAQVTIQPTALPIPNKKKNRTLLRVITVIGIIILLMIILKTTSNL